MKTENSLMEVWSWKEKIYQETKEMTMEERVEKIKAEAAELNRKYGLNLKLVRPDPKNRIIV